MIPKPGKNETEVQSYRPISLLPILSKLFEKALIKRIKPILIELGTIPLHQFGFREQHATVEQVHRVVKHIHNAFERRKYCSAVFLDVSQAFDKVWHIGLLYKLKQTLHSQLYQTIKSYLTDRYFFVQVQDQHTDIVPIQAGVPQGSVLGPLLYLIYTADLPLNNYTEIATFADDTVVMASHRNHQIASNRLQDHLTEIQNWLTTWRIKTNESKSTHVTFTLNRETCPPVQLNGIPLPQADDTKYLGMHLDRRLTWRKHIFTKRKQLGLIHQKLHWLMSRRSQLSIDNKLLIYSAIIKPVWTYGIQLWGSASNSNIEILQRFQSKVLREIADAPYYVPNSIIQNDLRMKSVTDEIANYSKLYQLRLSKHPNLLASTLATCLPTENRRLTRLIPSDLYTLNN